MVMVTGQAISWAHEHIWHMWANVVTALFDSKSLCWYFHCLSLHLIDANLATGWHHHQHKFPNLGTTLGIIFRCELCKLVIWCICFNSYISCVEMNNWRWPGVSTDCVSYCIQYRRSLYLYIFVKSLCVEMNNWRWPGGSRDDIIHWSRRHWSTTARAGKTGNFLKEKKNYVTFRSTP